MGAEKVARLKNIDPTPLASASIAQVHTAELPDGTKVVIKVQRPGIGSRVMADMKIMRGAVAAQREGVFEAYVETVFKAMWEQGLKMDDVEVIGEALEAAGLDAPSIMARAEEADVKQALIANTEAAVAAGVFGSPSFVVGGELYFGKDRLRDVEEAIVGSA